MKNQFYYTIETKEPPKEEGGEETVTRIMASFNLERVTNTVEYEPNKLMVFLDDYHLQYQTIRIPLFNKVGAHSGAFKTEYKECTVSAQIQLNEEDTKRYIELTEIK